jgi:hypothetical protein
MVHVIGGLAALRHHDVIASVHTHAMPAAALHKPGSMANAAQAARQRHGEVMVARTHTTLENTRLHAAQLQHTRTECTPSGLPSSHQTCI